MLRQPFNIGEEACGILLGFVIAAWHGAVLNFNGATAFRYFGSTPERDIQPAMHFSRLQQPQRTSPQVNMKIDE
jgi:hypothetical protein